MTYYFISFTKIGKAIPSETNPEYNDGYEREKCFAIQTKDHFETDVPDPEIIEDLKILAEFTAKELLALGEDIKWLMDDISRGIIQEDEKITALCTNPHPLQLINELISILHTDRMTQEEKIRVIKDNYRITKVQGSAQADKPNQVEELKALHCEFRELLNTKSWDVLNKRIYEVLATGDINKMKTSQIITRQFSEHPEVGLAIRTLTQYFNHLMAKL